MNAGIIILCKDKIFSRMLEIELRNAGYTVMRKSSSDDTYVVYIKDSGSKNIEITTSLNSVKRIFTRPFYVGDVVSYITILLRGHIQEDKQLYPESIDNEIYLGLTIDEDKRIVRFNGDEISLTNREYELLLYMYNNKGTPISREEAIAKVWKYDYNYTGDTNVVDVYIRYLRGKLDDKYNTKIIYTVRHKGYMIK